MPFLNSTIKAGDHSEWDVTLAGLESPPGGARQNAARVIQNSNHEEASITTTDVTSGGNGSLHSETTAGFPRRHHRSGAQSVGIPLADTHRLVGLRLSRATRSTDDLTRLELHEVNGDASSNQTTTDATTGTTAASREA